MSVYLAEYLQCLTQIRRQLNTYNGRLLCMLGILHDSPQLHEAGLATTWDVHFGEDDTEDVPVAEKVGLDWGTGEHVRYAVAHID